MKKFILTFAFCLFTNLAYAQAVGSGAWLFVPIIGSGRHPIVPGQEANTGPWRADTSALPLSVKGWSGQPITKTNCPVTITTDGCYLILVNEDFSKVGPTALSHWTKPTPTAVSDTLAAKGIDVSKYPALPPPNVVKTPPPTQSYLRRLWNLIGPALAWAMSCAPCDNFTRGNSNPISGSWTYGNIFSSTDYPQIYSNAVAIGGGMGIAYFTAFSWANNQESQVTLGLFTDSSPGSFNVLGGPTVRMDGNMAYDSANFYGALAAASTNYVEIDSYHPYPTGTITLGSASVSFVAGDTIKLRVVGETLTVYQNGISVATASGDGTILSGHPGLWIFDNYGVAVGVLEDDFTAADVGGAAIVRHIPIIQ